MAISSRGEMGVGGGSRGGFGGGGRSKAVKPTIKKKLAEPKSAVKVIPKMPMDQRVAFNINADAKVYNAKSGAGAKQGPAAMPKNPSYWQLKGLPSLVKINSGTGNKTVSPITYRGKATKKAAPAKRATGRKSN